MKCPFRTITYYTKNQRNFTIRQEGGFNNTISIEPCNESEAHNKIVDFSECLKFDCPYYSTDENIKSYKEFCNKIQLN